MGKRELLERIEELEEELEEIRDRIDAVLNSGDDSEDSDSE
jgi:uncharacterized protein (UPF0335 family)